MRRYLQVSRAPHLAPAHVEFHVEFDKKRVEFDIVGVEFDIDFGTDDVKFDTFVVKFDMKFDIFKFAFILNFQKWTSRLSNVLSNSTSTFHFL